MSDPIVGLIGVAGHYYTNFIETLLKEDQGAKFHCLIGIIMHRPDMTAGHSYIFIGKAGTGKTTIMNILRRVFETDARIIFVDDIDPNKIPIDPSKTYFIATNLPKERIKIKNATIFETSGIRFPKRIYAIYMHDFELFTDAYKLICDSEYQIWATALDLRNNL